MEKIKHALNSLKYWQCNRRRYHGRVIVVPRTWRLTACSLLPARASIPMCRHVFRALLTLMYAFYSAKGLI